MKRGVTDRNIINIGLDQEEDLSRIQLQNSSASTTPPPASSTYEEEWTNALSYFYSNPTMMCLKKNNENKHSFLRFNNTIIALANKNIDGILGQGGNGIVKLGQDNTGKYYAVKTERDKPIRKDEIQIMDMLHYYYGMIRRELLAPKMLAGKTTNAKIYTLMELQEGEELFVILDKLNYNQKLSAAIECCKAIKALHLKRIIHADIKPENFMVKMDRDVIEIIKSIDFGYSMLLPNGKSFIIARPYGTRGYIAPEIYSGVFSYYSDIYALGKTFQLDFKLPVHLYSKLLSKDPFQRCSLDEAINDLFEALRNQPDVDAQTIISQNETNLDVPRLTK